MRARAILALSIVLALLGWFALGSFTYHNPPVGWNRWIAVAILSPTLWASLLPLTYGIHVQLNHDDGILPLAARQSGLTALYLTLCAGLRLIGALNWANAVLLLALFVLTEVLLSTREQQ
jgi:hypothetical protein